MMSRQDRMNAIVILMRSRKKVTANELAKMFGVTDRTIYRDMQSLADTDVPIVATPGTEGGYELLPGFFVPPILFTKDEAVALFLGGTFVSERKGTPFQESIVSALAKLEELLPETTREPAMMTKNFILWDVPDEQPTSSQSEAIQTITEAMQGQRCIHVRYESDASVTERVVEPYGVIYGDGRWYLVGFCHLRGALRMFRVNRIADVRMEEEEFERPEDFDLEAFSNKRWAESLEHRLRRVAPGMTLKVSDRILDEMNRHWLHRYCQRTTLPDGSNAVTIHADDETTLMRMVLQWGHDVEVIAPEEIRERLRREGEDLTEIYGPAT
jgi:predicted DNA-binding transcriptional regulator YafY